MHVTDIGTILIHFSNFYFPFKWTTNIKKRVWYQTNIFFISECVRDEDCEKGVLTDIAIFNRSKKCIVTVNIGMLSVTNLLLAYF